MKISDLFEKDDRHGKRWAPDELDLVFKEAKRTTLSKEDAVNLAKEIAEKNEDLNRTETAIYQILIQLYALVHGQFPDGVVIYPGNWQNIADTVVRYAKSKGINVEDKIKAAKRDMSNRVAKKKSKLSKKAATEVMWNYYQDNKATLPKNINRYRDDIIKRLMDGEPVDQAFKMR